jgi:hypothetical protein
MMVSPLLPSCVSIKEDEKTMQPKKKKKRSRYKEERLEELGIFEDDEIDEK